MESVSVYSVYSVVKKQVGTLINSAPPYTNEVAALFNPDQFDAEEWVKLCKATGMKYVVPIGKFHDGVSDVAIGAGFIESVRHGQPVPA